tara:strand:+ start:1427 stop:1672 length:246 start_codon:yes stop_codon:yes gene_type:complete
LIHYNKDISNKETKMISKKSIKGMNIEVSNGQYELLYDLVMTAYELDIAEQKGWDVQTFDNLVDNVCQAQSTYLQSRVKGV